MVSEMREGTVEVGTVGREGMTGLPSCSHADTMPSRAFVQVPGHAYRMTATTVRAMDESPKHRRLVYRYVLALFDQTAQHAACNRLHALEERCARWLLMTHDRVEGDVLLLKQQFLAEMLGVHRPAVTIAAGALQKAGVIRYSRGKVTVLDRAALEERVVRVLPHRDAPDRGVTEYGQRGVRAVSRRTRRYDVRFDTLYAAVRTGVRKPFWNNELLAFCDGGAKLDSRLENICLRPR